MCSARCHAYGFINKNEINYETLTKFKTTAIYTHISHNLVSKIQSPINNIKL